MSDTMSKSTSETTSISDTMSKSTSETTSISDTKSKVVNKKKHTRQKEKVKVKTDVETNNEPGTISLNFKAKLFCNYG